MSDMEKDKLVQIHSHHKNIWHDSFENIEHWNNGHSMSNARQSVLPCPGVVCYCLFWFSVKFCSNYLHLHVHSLLNIDGDLLGTVNNLL